MKQIKLSKLMIKFLIAAFAFGLLMCVVNSWVGYGEFKTQIENLYGTITVQFAKTAASYIDVDKIPVWLSAGEDDSWNTSNQKLMELTNTAELGFIYVTVIDEDYKNRTYIFDTINDLVEDRDKYKIIPLGYVNSLAKKDAEYINNLKKVIEGGECYSSFKYSKAGGHVTTAVPLKNKADQNIGIVSVVKPMHEIAAFKKDFLKNIIFWASLLTIVFMIGYTVNLYLGIIKPILFITEETSNFAKHHGSLTGLLKKIKNNDEIGELAKSVEKMSMDMNKYIEDLTHTTAEKERLGAELNIATKIQAEMLPRIFPPFQNATQIELCANMEPAKEVGGDFYDFFVVDEKHFAFLVGDVSGKGVPAALFMVIAKTLIKDATKLLNSPARILEQVNDILCENNETGLFVTCWMGILNTQTGEVEYANAGHNAPVVSSQKRIYFLDSKPNLMLAAFPQIKYTNYKFKLEPNDRVFVYSDGVTEATDSHNQLYGEDRLLNAIHLSNRLSSKEVIALIKLDILDFVKSAPQFDDITMLDLIYKGHE